VRRKISRKLFLGMISALGACHGKRSEALRSCGDGAQQRCARTSPRLCKKLADLFRIFGKVVLDVAEMEGAENRFFRLARQEELKGGFDEAFGGGFAAVLCKFERTDADFVRGFA
jgi:hypothetical protein